MTVAAAPLVRWSAEVPAGVPLVCFPWAGAGAAVFREWAASLDGAVEVWGARLPGRESRIREAPVTSITMLAVDFAAAIESALSREPVLLGHCSGALLAYEVAFELARRGRLRPRQLLAVAQRAPSLTSERAPIASLDEELRRLGYVDDLLADPEMMALLRPAIEADFAMSAGFRYRPERRLDVPVAAFIGRQDGTLDVRAASAWARETTAAFELIELEGDHLFTGHARKALAAAVGEAVARARGQQVAEQGR